MGHKKCKCQTIVECPKSILVAGNTGSQGPQGPQGPPGQDGDMGPPGTMGGRGLRGFRGFTGSTGPAGPPGPAGQFPTCGSFELAEDANPGDLVHLIPDPADPLETSQIQKLTNIPSFQWAVQAGGTGSDSGNGIATDCTGNVYVTGFFTGTGTFGTITLTSSGTGDEEIFVAKLDSAGDWQWVVKAGGTGNDQGAGIATDSAGNVYVTGFFSGVATFGTITLTSSGGSIDIFVAKLDSTGDWQWVVKADGTNTDVGNGIATDCSGNVYVTGFFIDEATFGTITLTSSGGSIDIFVAKLDNTGDWQWAVKAGGNVSDQGFGIATDCSGNVYVTGFFQNVATFGTITLTSSGIFNDIFVAKLDSAGDWQWVVQAGGTGTDLGNGIATDCSGNVYVTGFFTGVATFGTITLTSSGGSNDIFVAKLNTAGDWQWVVKAGGTGTDLGNGIATDCSGNVYVTGFFTGVATFGTITLTSSGGSNDIFVAKLDSTGDWQWAVKAGGTGTDLGNGIATDCSGNVYVTGFFESVATFGTVTLTSSNDNPDVFVFKIRDNPRPCTIGVLGTGGSAGDFVEPVFFGIASPPVFSELLPSYDYYLDSQGKLVLGCKQKFCCDSLKFFGTACSDDQLIMGCCCPPVVCSSKGTFL